jgi:hypothetical protein
MSEEEFHVHGAHDHEVEHQAEHGIKLSQWVAILSAILACFAAIVSYQSTTTENEAIIQKNEAIIKTTKAADAWAFYQAKKNKAHLMEVAATLSTNPHTAHRFKQQLTRYDADAANAFTQAQNLSNNAQATEKLANQLIKPHHLLAQAMTLLQVAISLASITALTRKRWLLGVSIGAAALGVGLAIAGWMV